MTTDRLIEGDEITEMSAEARRRLSAMARLMELKIEQWGPARVPRTGGVQVNDDVWLLDAFCGAGGATKGYQWAGFKVVGVDIEPQPHYCGDDFVQADALDTLSRLLSESPFSAIHASPPCQRFSAMSNCRPGLSMEYADLIEPTRQLLEMSGVPWVIENVPGSPLKNPIELCGQMFGLDLYRHRLFESNFDITVPGHPVHVMPASKAGHWAPGTIMSVAGHFAPMVHARTAMGIDWMNRAELGESIPPAYTEYVGKQLMEVVRCK